MIDLACFLIIWFAWDADAGPTSHGWKGIVLLFIVFSGKRE